MNSLRIPEGVGLTALITAYARAQETRRADRLFADPLAERFIARVLDLEVTPDSLPRFGPAREDGTSELWNSLYGYFSGRTGFYDSYVTGQVDEGCRQVVILGAGLDTRTFRLPLPVEVVIYEIDTADVLNFKENVLAGAGARTAARRVPVVADLRQDWSSELLAAGFDPRARSAWMAEGLLMYLESVHADRLIDAITRLTVQSSTLAGEYLNRRTRLDDVPMSDEDDRAVAAVFVSADRGGPDRLPSDWLSAHGWTGDGPDFVDVLASLGRPVPGLFDQGKPDPLRLRMFSASRNR